ncbi:FG-GAP repeat domain-containing protein [Deinococcus roseus]|uniref:VCBS repeat-containing protein n=1 Tax=Deinococcus roseus TaxID=392414 RepID=A0ABQ2D7R1_9DEIO|nr:VCBS repeat-containing protein [Deinococcus roseus]GGJ47958.1 hypothetical protein GCM10008938_37480 [Deinococcus roseus]
MKKTLLSSLTLALLVSACSTTPLPHSEHNRSAKFKSLGRVELDLGTSGGIQKQALTFGNPQVQFKGISSNVYDVNGWRYFVATYAIRNASGNGTPDPNARTNITLVAAETANTMANTAIRKLRRADDVLVDPALAKQMFPMTAVDANLSPIPSKASFQALTQAEVDAILPATLSDGVLNLFPYGYVVDNVAGGRTLPGNPLTDQYDGTFTMAWKTPLQTPIENTPRKFSFIAEVLQDTETRVTEALDEQTADSNLLVTRANTAGATLVNILPGSTFTALPTRTICKIPLASGFNPPYLVNQTSSFSKPLPPTSSKANQNTTVKAVFNCADHNFTLNPLGSQFLIFGSFTGKRLTDGNPFNSGTLTQLPDGSWQYTPSATAGFKPGEEVEATINWTNAASAFVLRFRIGTGAQGAAGYDTVKRYATNSQSPVNITLGDVNNDGNLDLLVGYSGTNASSVSVLLGYGNGVFDARQEINTGTRPFGLQLHDFNGDGNLDIATANSTNTVSILLGNGNGTFQTKTDYATGNNPLAVTAGDLTGDGKPDLVVSNFQSGSNSISVLLNTGNGTFQAKTDYTTGTQPYHVTLADMNNDGRLDAVTANYGSSTTSVLLGNGDGTFQAKTDYATAANAREVAVGDVNGDNKTDVVVVSSTTSKVSVLLGNGDGTLQSKVDYTVAGLGGAVKLGDFDGNGNLDIITAHTNTGNVSILNGNGDGTFQTKVDTAVDPALRGLALGDINNDTKLDFAVVSLLNNRVSIFPKK